MSYIAKFRTYILILLCVLFTISMIRTVIKVNAAKNRVVAERERVEKLKEESLILENQLKIIQGNEFLEKQLRDKLGLAKEGETVLILPDQESLKKLVPPILDEEETLPLPIWRKWVQLFGI